MKRVFQNENKVRDWDGSEEWSAKCRENERELVVLGFQWRLGVEFAKLRGQVLAKGEKDQAYFVCCHQRLAKRGKK